ncbi:MAG: D-glycero-beta-D-manno-heptose 1-phosphate adenylyltransferase [Alphaproteobacteria bacterium]|nr:D-glycero-beta-D-manno-heptose 1-phosphate adenylyltransferase [Alphaproteobacteria bacterium]
MREQVLSAFGRPGIVCLGDLMLDRYVHGTVDRISPEAPIPVLKVASGSAVLGGVGNVARNIAALGGRARLLAPIGDDAEGLEIARLAEAQAGLEARLVPVAGRRSTLKTRFVAGGQQLLRADREDDGALPAAAVAALLAALEASLPGARALILSDYAKGALPPELLRGAIACARAAGAFVVVDPKQSELSLYAGARLIKPNARELAVAAGRAANGEADVVAAARLVLARAGAELVLVSRGPAGSSLVSADAAWHFPARAREVFDVSGAGDTMVATVTLALAAGLTPPQAAELANLAGGIAVGKAGTATVDNEELAAALLDAAVQSSERKIVSREGALRQVAQWRQAGLRVGFTNGCFDLLHPGHVSLLAEARAAADRLVVGLNSDASVRRLKGVGRPVQSETARAVVLASLASIDLVVLFEDDTPLALIEALRPDVLVKGADYSIEQVVGAEAVGRWGGRVLLARLLEGHSTSGTIRRLVAGEAVGR